MKARLSGDFENQRRVLLLETLYDAALSLSAIESEAALAEEVLSRAVSVLDASRGFFLTRGAEREPVARAAVGFSEEALDAASAEDPFLLELEHAARPVALGRRTLCNTAVANALGVCLRSEGRSLGWLVLADKESRRGASAFGSEDERFLSSLAALATLAIERRRHLERLEQERLRLEEENRRLRDESGRAAGDRLLVGESASTRRVIDLVHRAAGSQASVLITGESGTGKELVARLLHEKSTRRNAPFVAINCASLPESLLESELFGIERGVATGVEARSGKFEEAQGGTLFLDEIGDMPPALQAKILRVLQEREVEHVGGRRRIPLDVRVISATNADLARRIAQRLFREDLYYRLRVIAIDLPPLRQRREDLPRLVRYFLDRFAAREGRRAPAIDRPALAALFSYAFPGNIRELENLLEGAAALARDAMIRLEDLQWIHPPASDPSAIAELDSDSEAVALRAVENRHIQRILRLANGNKSRAARMLGINRRTLYRKKI